MPRLISARSDVTDSEMEKETLREFKELKEQYYLMENDRNDSTEKTQKILRKYSLSTFCRHVCIIEVLEAERKKESQEDSVERYEAAVARIKAMTGEDNLDLDVPKFIEVEDKNFALFNYVNEMNSEIELLNDQTKEIQKDIENFQNEGAQLDFERKKILNELESLRVEVSKDISIKEESVKEISKIFDQIKTAIKSVFTVTQCDPAPIDDLLGLSAGITQTNMIQYLGVIEQRVNELLIIQMYLSSKNQTTHDPKFKESEESDPRNALGSISFLPPSIGEEHLGVDENNDGEDELRPLTRSDLELQVLKSVKRREESNQSEDQKFEMMVNREKGLKSNQKKEFKKERI
uniref:ODAD1 central coiled coil region domain-containing protein n=1 Tax=Octopus bimaculoides TaxID=37653 RepID=A0A0L8FUQ6_OCTBM